MATPNSFPAPVMRALRRGIADLLGLAPQDWVMEARVRERMEACELRTPEEYLRLLAKHSEQTALAELLRVGETRFYRHESQMRGLIELVLPSLRTGRGPVRVWSAGCATGEEAYTLAMVLRRGLDGARPVHVLASDISPASLATAKAGVYREAALAALPASYHSSLEKLGNGHYRVVSSIRSQVSFEERNLATGPYPDSLDLIFCRNVLIYFEEEAKQAALRRLVGALLPGAFLFLGYSESLREVAGLEPVTSAGCKAYRRSDDALPALPARRRPRTSTPPIRAKHQSDATLLRLSGEYTDAKRLSEEFASALRGATERLVVDLDGADYLGQATAEAFREGKRNARKRGVSVRLCATREGHLRFLRRYELTREGDE